MGLSTLSSAVLATPLLLGLHPRAQEITFHPREDSKLEKRFTISTELELGTVTLEVNGQDATSEIPADWSLGFEVEFELVDHYVDMEQERPRELLREYKHLKGSYHAMDERDSIDESPDGAEVRFVWNEESKRYDISHPAGDTAPPEVQALFGIDTDYRALLPGKTVSKGDAWNIDQAQLVAALLPGIEINGLSSFPIAPEDVEGMEMLKTLILPELAKLGEKLETTCTFAGPREVDGRELISVDVTLDCDGMLDMSEFVRMAMIEGGELEEEQFEIALAELSVKLEGKGELLWDQAEGHVHAFALDVKLEAGLKVDLSASTEGAEFELHCEAELLGGSRWTMTKP